MTGPPPPCRGKGWRRRNRAHHPGLWSPEPWGGRGVPGAPPKPNGVPLSRSHELMCLCWQQNPRQRPSFVQLLERIKDHMVPAFRTLSFFYSPENRRRGSAEPSDAETDQSPAEDEPPASPLPNRKDGSPGHVPNGTA